jgi:hypothetical protein
MSQLQPKMTPSSLPGTDAGGSVSNMSAVVRNRFYSVTAFALAALVFVGFARTFYFRAWFDVPPTTVLLFLHGIAFTAWFLLFVVQTRLIAAQNYRLHMQLGIAGIIVAIAVVILGYSTAIVSAAAPRPRAGGMNSQQFVFIPLLGITIFAVFVSAAVALRKKAQLHKRFMTLAMIGVLGPPVARIILITDAGAHFLAIQTAVPALFIGWCLVSDWRKYRIVHPVYLYGGLFIVASWPIRVMIARTPAWEHVGRWLAGM